MSQIDVKKQVDHVFSIANFVVPYQADKYKDVIIPMTIIRRLECAGGDQDEVCVVFGRTTQHLMRS